MALVSAISTATTGVTDHISIAGDGASVQITFSSTGSVTLQHGDGTTFSDAKASVGGDAITFTANDTFFCSPGKWRLNVASNAGTIKMAVL